MMDRKQFMGLFPWKKIIKLSTLFLLYTVLCGILLFSLEECLNDKYSKSTYKQNNATPSPLIKTTPITDSNSSHVTPPIRRDTVENLTEVRAKELNISHVVQKCTLKENRKCEITSKRVMKWMYFTVVHLHGAGKRIRRGSLLDLNVY